MGPEWRALQAAAPELDARLAATPWRTLCHGDFKAANLLFSGSSAASSLGGGASGGSGGGSAGGGGDSPARGAGIHDATGGAASAAAAGQALRQPAVRAAGFDFQWVGGGSGLKDVAKLLCNSVEPQLLEGGGEEALLRFYHQQLLEGLAALAASPASGTASSGSGTAGASAAAAGGAASGGGGSSASGGGPVGCPAKAAQALEQYGFQQLQADFRLALADYVRFCAGWPRGLWGNTQWATSRAQACLEELGLA